MPAEARLPRIAALQPSVSIILERIGALDSLVACTRYCVEAVPELAHRDVAIVKDSWSSTTEEILSSKPSLVIACVPYRMESLAAILKAGCPVVALAPHTLADIYADIRLLGSITHRSAAAEEVVSAMQGEIAAVQARIPANAPRPLVYCEEWGKPLIHSQPWVAELVQAAGGRFLGNPAQQTTPEAVAAADPDLLVFCWCGAGDRVPVDRVVAKRHWQDLRAVREGRMHCIADEWLNSPAPSILLGFQALAAAIHPSRFGAGETGTSPDTVASPEIAI